MIIFFLCFARGEQLVLVVARTGFRAKIITERSTPACECRIYPSNEND